MQAPAGHARGKKPFLSDNPGSYNNARQALPLTLVEQSFDHALEQLIARTAPVARRQRAFFLDGTTVRMPHNPELCGAYPPARNQRGASHWPILRMLVAHDLDTGLAMRPEWGAVHGSQNVSEQSLVDRCIGRLPELSVLVCDSNFGVFSVAYAAWLHRHPVVVRLTPVRAQSLLKGPLEDGIDRRIEWEATKGDRRSHPELPKDVSLEGRLLVRLVQPSDGKEPFLLALFTTLEGSAGEIFPLYGKRWDIETDLCSLKSTLQLDQLSCTSVEMVAKEIDTGILAYNLVRAIMAMAAEQTGLPPRSFSFTRVRKLINTFEPLIASAKTQREADQQFDKMMYYAMRAILRKRKRKSYPRAAWGPPRVFPKHEK